MPIIKKIDEAMKIVEQYRNKQLIPVDWIKSKKSSCFHEKYDYVRGYYNGYNACIDYLISEWEEENEKSGNSD